MLNLNRLVNVSGTIGITRPYIRTRFFADFHAGQAGGASDEMMYCWVLSNEIDVFLEMKSGVWADIADIAAAVPNGPVTEADILADENARSELWTAIITYLDVATNPENEKRKKSRGLAYLASKAQAGDALQPDIMYDIAHRRIHDNWMPNLGTENIANVQQDALNTVRNPLPNLWHPGATPAGMAAATVWNAAWGNVAYAESMSEAWNNLRVTRHLIDLVAGQQVRELTDNNVRNKLRSYSMQIAPDRVKSIIRWAATVMDKITDHAGFAALKTNDKWLQYHTAVASSAQICNFVIEALPAAITSPFDNGERARIIAAHGALHDRQLSDQIGESTIAKAAAYMEAANRFPTDWYQGKRARSNTSSGLYRKYLDFFKKLIEIEANTAGIGAATTLAGLNNLW